MQGCVSSQSAPVTLDDPPAVTVELVVRPIVCHNQSVTLKSLMLKKEVQS